MPDRNNWIGKLVLQNILFGQVVAHLGFLLVRGGNTVVIFSLRSTIRNTRVANKNHFIYRKLRTKTVQFTVLYYRRFASAVASIELKTEWSSGYGLTTRSAYGS